MVGPVIFDTIKRYLNWQHVRDLGRQPPIWRLRPDQRSSTSQGIPMARSPMRWSSTISTTWPASASIKSTSCRKQPSTCRGSSTSMKLIPRRALRLCQRRRRARRRQGSSPASSTTAAPFNRGEGGGHAGKKRNPGDFALWKSAKAGKAFERPWGKGAGWHIECSAMYKAILGETFPVFTAVVST